MARCAVSSARWDLSVPKLEDRITEPHTEVCGKMPAVIFPSISTTPRGKPIAQAQRK